MKKDVAQNSPLAIGRKDLLRHLEGARLTQRQMIHAKCYECMCGHADGRRSCKMDSCPLYPLMPFKDVE